MSVHYVVAAYLGPRRIEDPVQKLDRLYYLRAHLASLQRLTHRLDRLTVVVHVDEQSCEGDQLLHNLIRLGPWKQNIEVIWRPNDIGLSYSAMREAVRPEYEYTIFNEDDYIFTHDNFDRVLVDRMDSRPDVSLICGCVCEYPGLPGEVAAISCGIVRTSALTTFQVADVAVGRPQLAWSFRLARAGLITDWLHGYASAYWQDGLGVRWFERPYDATRLGLVTDVSPFANEFPLELRRAFVVPVQALGDHVPIFYAGGPRDGHRGRVDHHGYLEVETGIH